MLTTFPRRAVLTTALGVAAITGAAATILWTMGRTLWCECGRIALWSGDVWSNENSQQLADPYSFTHFTHGVIFFWAFQLAAGKLPVQMRLLLATVIEAGWELVENTDYVINRYREVTMSLDYYGDSVFNSVGDVGFFVGGFLVATRYSWRVALIGIGLLELVLAVWIRDGLLLNIIMLLYPLDAIRAWQMGG